MITYFPCLSRLEGVNLEDYLSEHLNVKVFIENDINTMAYAETKKWEDFCHIFWDKRCIGSAIILDGHLIRGAHGAEGELEWVCSKGDCID